jgi:glycosyltransferase involved in cell wall biosynthesis
MTDLATNHTQSDSATKSAPAGGVAVVIPVYNRLRFLDAAIESVLAQTLPASQIIVIDDGSKEDAAPAVAKYGNRIEFYRQKNGGVAAARNHGLSKAHGQWILFLDDDDTLEPTALENLVGAASREGAMWAAGCYASIDEHGKRRSMPKRRRYESGDIYPQMIQHNLMGSPATVLARIDAIRSVGYFDESFRLREDYDLWISLARRYPIAVTQEVVTNYRISPGQISSNWDRCHEAWLDVLIKQRRQARDGLQGDFDRAIARIHVEYGDDLYLHGRRREARREWRQAFSQGCELSIGKRISRVIKSYLPQGILASARKVAGKWRGKADGVNRPRVTGTGELVLRERQ